MIRAHQPGSQPIDIPEVIPNPAVVPKQDPAPKEPAPQKPVKVPEKVPAQGVSGTCGLQITKYTGVSSPHETVWSRRVRDARVAVDCWRWSSQSARDRVGM
jgi:hypothetical protein